MKYQWKIVFFVFSILMIVGLCLSLYGIEKDAIHTTWLGLTTIAAVCVSWWMWVMFIIRQMMLVSDRADQNLLEIKNHLKEIKRLVSAVNLS